jgi:hypothetical protein
MDSYTYPKFYVDPQKSKQKLPPPFPLSTQKSPLKNVASKKFDKKNKRSPFLLNPY